MDCKASHNLNNPVVLFRWGLQGILPGWDIEEQILHNDLGALERDGKLEALKQPSQFATLVYLSSCTWLWSSNELPIDIGTFEGTLHLGSFRDDGEMSHMGD